MSDDFFIRPAGAGKSRDGAVQNGPSRTAKPAAKRKATAATPRTKRTTVAPAKRAPTKRRRAHGATDEDDEDHGDDEMHDGLGADAVSSEAEAESEEEAPRDPYANETPDEKRLRLAQELIKSLAKEDESVDDDVLAERLRQQAKDTAGLLTRRVASQLRGHILSPSSIKYCKGHRLPVTAVALTEDERHAFSASKDGTIIKWDVETGKKLHVFASRRTGAQGHKGAILSLAVTSDGKYLASGGADKAVHIWDLSADTYRDSLTGHRDAVSALAFRLNSHQLFSGGFDRAVKVWNVDEMAYVETLFGHQAEITSIDSLAKERAITAGRDRSVRLWKIVEETQLLFQGHTASIDCVKMMTEDLFVTGSEDGALGVWNVHKKKPLAMVPNAHVRPGSSLPCWISALASVRNSDLLASGSSDGSVKLWEWSPGDRRLSEVLSVPMVGVVNSLLLSKSARLLVAGLGRDHRFGRWATVSEGQNALALVPLPVSME